MRAPWLEAHTAFEGVGGHELNDRYDHVDDNAEEFDPPEAGEATPALANAETLMINVSSPGRLDGGDSSHYQANKAPFNLRAARQAGLKWWAHKVSQSTSYLDPTWHPTALAMQIAGFDQMLGYHWLSSTTDPTEQAAWFLRCMGDNARIMGAMGDCEEQGLTVEMCLAFYEPIEDVTHKPSPHYTGAYVGGGHIFSDPRIRESAYGPRPVILAAYTTRAKMMNLPNVRALGIHAWQFSSSGPVAGVTGRCDMDEILDVAAFDLACHDGHGIHGTPDAPIVVTVPPVVAVTNPPEDPMLFVLDTDTRGSCWVELVRDTDGNPHHKMTGFNSQAERDVWAMLLPVKHVPDDVFDEMVATKAT